MKIWWITGIIVMLITSCIYFLTILGPQKFAIDIFFLYLVSGLAIGAFFGGIFDAAYYLILKNHNKE